MAVDESIVPFKGRSSVKQYMLMKPVKRVYNVWYLSEYRTGFVSQFDIHSRRSDTHGFSSFFLGERVVLSLCDTYIHSHRLIAFDNFFHFISALENFQGKGSVCRGYG